MSNLKRFRESEKLSQKEMAKTLDVSLSQYTKIEQGEHNPSYNFLKKFKVVYPDVVVDDIFFK